MNNDHAPLQALSKHTDEELLKLIASDDCRAFKELFDRYWTRAYKIALAKLKRKEIAEEIVLDVFMSFWQRRGEFVIDNFASYVSVAVKYRVITYIDRELQKQKKYIEGLEELKPVAEEKTMTPVEYNELVRAIELGVRTLPEKTQYVFRLNRLEGRSVSEIAHLLNLSEKAIQYHITRSVKELKVYLKDYLWLAVVVGEWV